MKYFSFTLFLLLIIAMFNLAISKDLLEAPQLEQTRFKRAANCKYHKKINESRHLNQIIFELRVYKMLAWNQFFLLVSKIYEGGQCREPDETVKFKYKMYALSAWDNCNYCDCRREININPGDGQPGFLNCLTRSCTTKKCDSNIRFFLPIRTQNISQSKPIFYHTVIFYCFIKMW